MKWLKALLALASVLLALWFVAVAGLWAMQDVLVFRPVGSLGISELNMAASEQGIEPLVLNLPSEPALYGWLKRSEGKRLVIYFHGGRETVADSVDLIRTLTPLGWDVLAVSMRGFPGSPGEVNEEAWLDDAGVAFRYSVRQLGFRPSTIVLHGHELGGATATRIAAQINPRALVLEGTYFSVERWAKEQAPFVPVSLLLHHPFYTHLYASRTGVPTLILHSQDDPRVPVAHSEDLAPLFAEGQLVVVPGGVSSASLDRSVGTDAYLRFLMNLQVE